MRDINVSEITKAIRKLCIDVNYYLSDDVRNKLKEAYDNETFDIAKDVLSKLIINADIAKADNVPMCQDTGVTCVFIEIGQEVHIIDGSLVDAINQGVREGYKDGYLRKSVVIDPLNRVNTKDNTPAMIYYDIVPGDKLKIKVSPKGFGSENMSKLKMLKPSDGVEGVKDFIIDVVKQAGPNPCPPIIVGIGIGGTFDKAATIAKKSLLRPTTERNSNPYYAELEMELLEKINMLGIGPQGFGGKSTALAVNIEYLPTHIAGLPVAVNISCHATRHSEIEL